jgi:hypothetical protein
MITNQKIIDEVNKLLVQEYPQYPVYINKVPNNFERPSFFIKFIIESSEDVNRSVSAESVYLQLIYFANEDEYGITDSIEQQEGLRKLKTIFSAGYIRVEDRAVKVKATGKTVDGEIALDMAFSYYEEKVLLDQIETQHELIGDISIKQELRR